MTADGFANRTCPICETDHLCLPSEAKAVFRTSRWGADALLDEPDAELVCSFCHWIRVDGRWSHLSSPRRRAYELSEAGSKDTEYYEALFRKDPVSGRTAARVETSDPDGYDW